MPSIGTIDTMSPNNSPYLLLATNCRALLHYDIQELPGAMTLPYLDSRALDRLMIAQEYLAQESTANEKYELLIWDAYRTVATQSAIYDKYVRDVAAKEGISFEEAYPKGLDFVNSPHDVFPHGTGGTVDLTLLINGKQAEMGTTFDEFNDRSHQDWFRNNEPSTESDRAAHKNRELLRAAMEAAGYIGLPFEWWHYEWGTKLWSDLTGMPVILTSIHGGSPTSHNTPAYLERSSPKQPAWHAGVAQVFEHSRDRSSALIRQSYDHYYARTSHPSVNGLGNYLKEYVVPANYASLVTSGISACRTAVLAIMSQGGILVCDKRIYYEVGNEIQRLSNELKWEVHYADFSNPEALRILCKELQDQNKHPDAFYCDSPMNWWLETVDLTEISAIAKEFGGLTLVDITIQPLRPDILNIIDVAMLSLSKYPSLGLTLGGAIMTNNATCNEAIEQMISRTGGRLSGDSATTIWGQVLSMRDRLSTLRIKRDAIVESLKDMPEIRGFKYIQRGKDNPSVGGLLIIDMQTRQLAATVERLVSYNTTYNKTSLNLAYTFGASMTTLEHFHSNPRPTNPLNPPNKHLASIPDTYVRIGIGCEPSESIITDLVMAIDAAGKLQIKDATT